MARGRFITLEGGEGAGKSTQATRLVAFLSRHGIEVVRTREPGGSPGAEALRGLLVNGTADRWSATAETLLMYAARADHLERTVRPALAAGRWVVCDRFADSTRAYQGAGGGVDQDFIETVDRAVVGDTQPDLTLVFDMPVSTGLKRALARGGAEDRFEGKGLEFHERLRTQYLRIVADHADRCVLIDADASPQEVFDRVCAAVGERLGLMDGVRRA